MTQLVGQTVKVKKGHFMTGDSGQVVAYVQKNVTKGQRRPFLVELTNGRGQKATMFFAGKELQVTEG